MTVIDTLIAFFISAGFSIVMGFIMWKTDHVPGNAAKAAEELVKQMDDLEASFRRIDGNGMLRIVDRGGIGLLRENVIETKPFPTTTASCVTSASYKRCAYCDTLNDHETGVCDRCGAPLP